MLSFFTVYLKCNHSNFDVLTPKAFFYHLSIPGKCLLQLFSPEYDIYHIGGEKSIDDMVSQQYQPNILIRISKFPRGAFGLSINIYSSTP
jgi:hypothetical protein